MKKIFYLIFIIFINLGNSTKAQEIQKKLDSLISVWNNSEIDDSSRFPALNDFILGFKSINSDSAFHYVDLMLSEASLKGFKRYIIKIFKHMMYKLLNE